MARKIYLRFVFMIILVALLATSCGAMAYYALFEKQVHEDLQVTAQILRDTGVFQNADIAAFEANPKLKEEKLRVTLVDTDGKVLFDNTTPASSMNNHLDRPEIAEAMKNSWGEEIRKSDTIDRVDYYYAIVLDDGRILRISKEVDSLWNVIISAIPYCMSIIIIVSIIGTILSKLLTQSLVAPIIKVAENLDDDVEAPYPELYPFVSEIRKQHDKVLNPPREFRTFQPTPAMS